MDENSVVPPDHFQAANQRSAGAGVAFVDDRVDAAGRGESSNFSAEPAGEDE